MCIGEENIHRRLSGAAYHNEYGRRKDSFQYLNCITTVLAAAISYSSYEDRQYRREFLKPQYASSNPSCCFQVAVS